MLSVNIIAIGSIKEKFLKDAIAEYQKRMKGICNFKIIELPEVKSSDSEALIEKALLKEATMIEEKLGNSFPVPMCVEGCKMSSEQLSKFISNKAVMGESAISFIIGSSHGLHPKIKAMGKALSMSDMTFPHQFFRVMLLEQVYRAFQIQLGTKYHK